MQTQDDPTQLDAFDRQIAGARQRLKALRRQGQGLSPAQEALFEEMLEAFSATVEELQVAGEELHHQNEALVEAYEDLDTARRRYQDLFEFAPDGYLVTDTEGGIRAANRAAAALFGVKRSFIVGKSLSFFVEPQDQARFRDQFDRFLQEVMIQNREADVRRSEWEMRMGSEHGDFPAALTVAPMWNQQNRLSGLRWLVRDISASKRAEERERLLAEKRRQQALQERLLAVAPVGIVATDRQGRITLTNQTAERLYARPIPRGEAYESHAALQLCYPDGTPYAPRDLPLTRAALDGEATHNLEMVIRQPDGQRRDLLVSAAPIRTADGEVTGAVGAFQDITEFKQLRRELRTSQDWLQLALSVAEIGTWHWDLDTDLDTRDAGLNRILGLEAQESTQPVGDFIACVHPDDRAMVEAEIQRALDEGGSYQVECRIVRPDGEVRWIRDQGRVFADPAYMAGAVVDITERMAARQALRRHTENLERLVAQRTAELEASYARFQAIFEEAAIGIALVDQQGRVVSSNPALQRILGYNEEELIDMSLASLTHPDNVGDDMALYNALMAGERDYYRVQGRYIHKNGQPIHANLTVSLVRWHQVQARFAIVMIEDITERKEAQAALVQAEKLSLTGRMVASLVHEINNPLQSVVGYLSLAQEMVADCQLEEAGDTCRYLDVAIQELKRTAGIVNRVRDFNRAPSESEKQPTDVNAMITRILTLSEKFCHDHYVEVVWEPGEDLPLLPLALDRVHQVFLNLVLNAIDAMPEGGELRITTARTEDPEGVRISFADSGEGIPVDEMAHLFEPFHTTKSEGLGLGLYVSQRIVRDHGGRIDVESTEGAGATFTVWLPA
jgi:PAS domain S-box-containing protein